MSLSAPKKIAIIMDGNGRWADRRGLPRSYGHIKGTRVAKKIILDCANLGVETLVLYAFSTENWNRPAQEVNLLMRILNRYLIRETDNLVKKNIRFSVIGELSKLPNYILKAIEHAIDQTANCSGLHLIFALSYGGRREITEACRSIAEKIQTGQLQAHQIDEKVIQAHLNTPFDFSPDLVIRTSGELRISNFLLWQIAYSEFYFTQTLWPDFSKNDLLVAFENYRNRQRRFGMIGSFPNNDDRPDSFKIL